MRPSRLFADQYEGDQEPNLSLYAKAGHVLYAHKASQGTDHIDTAHRRRVISAHKQGLTVLHYHYCQPSQFQPQVEVSNFMSALHGTQVPGDLVAFDFESASGGLAGSEYQHYYETIWNEMKARSGHAARTYGSTSFLSVYVRRSWLRFKPRWQAQYGVNPRRSVWGTPWWAWQFTDGLVGPAPRALPGVTRCDVSMLNLKTALLLEVRTARRRRTMKDQ